jgi:catalase
MKTRNLLVFGASLLQDYILHEKMAHQQGTPERVVHAKVGALGHLP